MEELGFPVEATGCAGAMDHSFEEGGEAMTFRSTLFLLEAGPEADGEADGGTDEIDAVRWVSPAELPGMAARLRSLAGAWAGWGAFRASAADAMGGLLRE
jgi:8-oxo-dGTP pyrophosphatase MutT (NUDIX family)